MDCLFCRIVAGEIPSTKVYEDDQILAFRDIAPQAPTHILLIPKCHIEGAHEITAENSSLVAHIFEVAAQLARQEGLEKGYRILTNVGLHGAQSVKHLHFHLIGGRQLAEQLG